MVQISAMSSTATSGRRGERRPVFRAALELEPWEITPFCCFPLLPGETLHNVLIDGRFLLNGCVSPLFPWYLDLQMYAVKLSDLDIDFELILKHRGDTGPSGLANSAAAPHLGEAVGGITISGLVYKRICDQFWKTDNVLPNSIVNTDLFIAPVKWRGSSSTHVEGENPDDFLRPDEILTDAMKIDLLDRDPNWDDILRSYGVVRSAVEAGVPERIMWESMAKFPVFVQSDAADTIVTRYQVLWSIREARLTARGQGLFAKEPMAVMGMVTIRPEIIEGNKAFMMINDLTDRERWWVPPFNTMDAVQDILQEPGSGITAGHSWVDAAPGVTQMNMLDYWFMGESFTNMDWKNATPPDAQLAGHLADSPKRSAAPVYEADFIGHEASTLWPVLKSDAFLGGHIQVQTRVKTHLAAIA